MKKENLCVWGTGKVAKTIFPSFFTQAKKFFHIIGFFDNFPQNERFFGYNIFNAELIQNIDFDKILICCNKKNTIEIRNQLLEQYNVPNNKIFSHADFLKNLLKKKYKNSTDKEVCSFVDYLNKDNEVSVFNNFITAKDSYDEVFWDKNIGLPYILFQNINNRKVKMYYPNEYDFTKHEGKLAVKNLMYEQAEESPHIYIKSDHKVDEGDIIMDVGVCEGNFALRYAELASQIYLFESDPTWEKPLFYSFAPYAEKTTFIPKRVGASSEEGVARIDEYSPAGKHVFLKMDIEGDEVDALKGARNFLTKNLVKCSICSYHRHGDEKRIRDFLEKQGYMTSISSGYMLFLYGKDFWKYLDLRRGIVYGRNT